MVSDGTEFAVGDIERLFEEARRNTKAKHEKWEKYYNRHKRDVQIKVNDWVLVATHPLSSATRKVVAKFEPKFKGPYRVLGVKNNNVVIWKSGKRLTINVDQVRIYRHRKCDETEIGTGSSRITVVCAMNRVVLTEYRVQRRSNESQDNKKKGSEVKRELEDKWLSFRNDQGEKHTNKTNKREPLIRSIPNSWSVKGRMIKKSKNERKKSRTGKTVTPTTSGYNLRPRNGKGVESRPTIERKTQQGGPIGSRKGRGRNDSPYIEERTKSSNKNARRGGDQERQDQERRGACTKMSLSREVLLTKFEQGRVLGLPEGGFSFCDIAERHGQNISTEYDCWKQWSRDGAASKRPGSGRPLDTTVFGVRLWRTVLRLRQNFELKLVPQCHNGLLETGYFKDSFEPGAL
ncbi:uncharacterized protein TNCV_2876951 [Trichonephila clavipes]|uniref:Uncharacterized protein n=1 Tax=Trichonephila clavipes TaxID=2585209 RepID=A0A8X6WEY9_TRICX|nr:uncharacterized protein TNCV_2876951 [Trichonephila clavipes]